MWGLGVNLQTSKKAVMLLFWSRLSQVHNKWSSCCVSWAIQERIPWMTLFLLLGWNRRLLQILHLSLINNLNVISGDVFWTTALSPAHRKRSIDSPLKKHHRCAVSTRVGITLPAVWRSCRAMIFITFVSWHTCYCLHLCFTIKIFSGIE